MINFNGKIVSKGDLRFNDIERGFRYGDGCFTSAKCYGVLVHNIEAHIYRLKKSCNILGINYPKILAKGLDTEISKVLIDDNNSRRLRITIFRDSKGLYTPENNDSSFLIESEKIGDKEDLKTNNSNDLSIAIFRDIKIPIQSISFIKSISSLFYVLAGKYAKDHGLDDVILLNSNGNICETVSSNIFIIKNGEVFTPSLDEGCVEGTFRRMIIDKLKTSRYKINEISISEKLLNDADEIFLTNALNGIKSVKKIGKKLLKNHTTSDILGIVAQKNN